MNDAGGTWDRVKQVFQAALNQAPAQRAAFLHDACGDDRDLKAEVDSLLEAHGRAGSFAEQAAIADLPVSITGGRVESVDRRRRLKGALKKFEES